MSFWVLVSGVVMMALTIGIHAIGSVLWLKVVAIRHKRRIKTDHTWPLFRAVITTGVVLLLLHFIEMILWAFFYLFMPQGAGLKNLPDAIYFSMVTFTTLGYGDITLNMGFRQLSGMEGMVGIVVFGLTTAILFSVVQQLWKFQHHD
jgi:voltage-gated potassium channel